MNEHDINAALKQAWQIHAQVEAAYLCHPATIDHNDWLAKRRLLLADMAIHLLDTVLKPGELNQTSLTNNLNAILTISHEFMPEKGLASAAEQLYK